jgi:hypothetical protein
MVLIFAQNSLLRASLTRNHIFDSSKIKIGRDLKVFRAIKTFAFKTFEQYITLLGNKSCYLRNKKFRNSYKLNEDEVLYLESEDRAL